MRSLFVKLVAVVAILSIGSFALAQTGPMDDAVPAAGGFFDDDDFEGPQVSDSGVGYIDNAILGNQIRFRFDAAYNNVQPARAEFFWPVDGPFGPGPGPETRADYQDLSLYAEYQFACRWSAFGAVPFRMLNGEIQPNTAGLGDATAGVKYALYSSCNSVATFQFRTYIPTASGTRGLGTRHVSLEPALLVYHRLNDRLSFQGEIRDWIAIGGTDGFAGNVLRYGLGANYTFNPCDCRPLSAVVELVGWTVLNGDTLLPPPAPPIRQDAAGDTIVNAKVGLRYSLNCSDSIYAGYGRALSDQTWYDDVFRFEFRRAF